MNKIKIILTILLLLLLPLAVFALSEISESDLNEITGQAGIEALITEKISLDIDMINDSYWQGDGNFKLIADSSGANDLQIEIAHINSLGTVLDEITDNSNINTNAQYTTLALVINRYKSDGTTPLQIGDPIYVQEPIMISNPAYDPSCTESCAPEFIQDGSKSKDTVNQTVADSAKAQLVNNAGTLTSLPANNNTKPLSLGFLPAQAKFVGSSAGSEDYTTIELGLPMIQIKLKSVPTLTVKSVGATGTNKMGSLDIGAGTAIKIFNGKLAFQFN